MHIDCGTCMYHTFKKSNYFENELDEHCIKKHILYPKFCSDYAENDESKKFWKEYNKSDNYG